MLKKHRKIFNPFLLGVILVLVVSIFFADGQVMANNTDDFAWDGNAQAIQDTTGLGEVDPRIIAARIINIFLGFLGIIAVILIMYAGFLWMNSGGNPDYIGKAKKILISAVIGLILILSCFALASFVLDALFDASNGNGNNNPPSYPPGPPRPPGPPGPPGGPGNPIGCSASADECVADQSICSGFGPWWSCNPSTCFCEVTNLGSCYNPDENICSVPCSMGLACSGSNGCQGNEPVGGCGEGYDECRCCCSPSDDQCSQIYPTLECRPDIGDCSGASRGMCCGCTADIECGQNINSAGCGSDTCCNQRPVVEEVTPTDNSSNVCTNSMVSIRFSSAMKSNTFNDNILLIAELGGACPAGTSLLDVGSLGAGVIAQPGMNYCRVNGSYNSRSDDSGFFVDFISGSFLKINTKYYVIVRGGDLNAEATDIVGGAESYFSISMSHDFVSTFRTINDPSPSAGICEIDKVVLRPPSYLFRSKQNSTRENDDDANDPSFDSQRDKDKAFAGEALSDNSQKLAPIPGYQWDWTMVSSASSIVSLNDTGQIANLPESSTLASVADTAKEGRSQITATIDMSAYPGNTINVGNGKFDRSNVFVFICNNPWPPLDSLLGDVWQPWSPQNNIFNYDIYYCRDKGKNGTADDLPAFNSEGITASPVDDVLQMTIFTYEAPPAPGSIQSAYSTTASAEYPDGGAVTLEWSGSTELGVTGYNVYWGTVSKNPSYSVDAGAVVRYNVGGLNNGTKYYFTVTAYNGERAESSYYDEVSATPVDTTSPTGVPEFILDQIEVTKDSIELYWNDVEGAYSYDLSYGFSATEFGITTDTQGDTAVRLIDLNPGVEYHVGVRAKDSSGNVGEYAIFGTSTLSGL